MHQPGEATVNAITMSEQRSVGRSKERSDVRGSGVADRVHAVVRAEVSVNAAKARSNTNTSSTTTRLQSSNATDNRARQQGKKTLESAKPELVGTKSWEHAAKKAGAQVKKECKLTTVPAEAGYRHLYLLEVNRRAKKIMHNRERRSKRRENRRTGQATAPEHFTE